MDDIKIPDEVVEAAVKELWGISHGARVENEWFLKGKARAAIAAARPAIRNEALKEAARVCDGVAADPLVMFGMDAAKWQETTAKDCAAAIRALMEKP